MLDKKERYCSVDLYDELLKGTDTTICIDNHRYTHHDRIKLREIDNGYAYTGRELTVRVRKTYGDFLILRCMNGGLKG